jgi:hypothetical protein
MNLRRVTTTTDRRWANAEKGAASPAYGGRREQSPSAGSRVPPNVEGERSLREGGAPSSAESMTERSV